MDRGIWACRRSLWPFGFGLLLLVLASSASAGILRYSIEFEARDVDGDAEEVAELFTDGDRFTLVLDVSDTETVLNGDTGEPAFKIERFLVEIAGLRLQGVPRLNPSISVSDSPPGGPGGDALGVWGSFFAQGAESAGEDEVLFSVFTARPRALSLHDTSGQALTGAALPRSLDLDDFDRVQGGIFQLGVLSETPFLAHFSTRPVSLAIVPEPATIGLVAFGVLALGWLRRDAPGMRTGL